MTMWDLPRNGRVVQHGSINQCNIALSEQRIKNHMNLSKGTEKALDKTQCLFMIKNSQKQGMEGKFLKIIKAIMKSAQLTLYSMVRKRNLSL